MFKEANMIGCNVMETIEIITINKSRTLNKFRQSAPL